MIDIFGMDLVFDAEDFGRLASRLALDLLFTTLVVAVVYRRLYHNREFVFTYYIFNVITFSLCILLRKVPMELGFALGLFAVFGMLRYRTEEIRMRDLTYLFIVIGLGILNAVANRKVSLVELLTVNSVIVGLTMVIELRSSSRRYRTTAMLYDRIDLLRPGQSAALLHDLSERTGLRVVRVDVQRVDMLRDAAEITICYHAAEARL